ncbi:MAG: hypothetical protein H7196_01915 [candidate division SR1 bacterium]|nr:hypothetical protein [candidate division SR1 bacterium]
MTNQILKYFGFFFVFCILFGSGFYFGFKTSQSQVTNLTATKSDIKALADSSLSSQDKIVTKEVEGVFWITPGQKPDCPETHKIKAKFNNTNSGIFYSPDNKNYAKVTPQLCFATEEFARNKGFLKKY